MDHWPDADIGMGGVLGLLFGLAVAVAVVAIPAALWVWTHPRKPPVR